MVRRNRTDNFIDKAKESRGHRACLNAAEHNACTARLPPAS